MTRFDACAAFVLQGRIEGGYANDPTDRGGPTNMGITQTNYTAWLRKRGLRDRDVKNLARSQAELIYRDFFWAPVHADSVPIGLDLFMFDSAVQHSYPRAIKILQAALGIVDDGVFGVLTAAAMAARVNANGLPDLVHSCFLFRKAFYDEIVSRDKMQLKWYHGWTSRLALLRQEIDRSWQAASSQ